MENEGFIVDNFTAITDAMDNGEIQVIDDGT